MLDPMKRTVFPLFVTLFVTASLAIANPKPEETWPGFRGHDMSGVAPGPDVPERWSTTENVNWAVPMPGHGWSSPIVWGDTVFVTSAISSKPFKKPTPGLYGNEYIAEMQAQGLSNEEISKRVARARQRVAGRGRRDPLHGLRARRADRQDQVGARGASRRMPFGGRHRKNTYASETPFTDGERLYASFGQNVGLFVLLARRQAALEEAVGAAADLPRLRHRLVADRVTTAASICCRTTSSSRPSPRSTRRPARSSGARRGRAAAFREVVVDDAVRVEERAAHRDRDDRARRWCISYDLDGKELWRVDADVDADRLAVRGRRHALRRHRLAGRREPAVLRDQAGRVRRHLARRPARPATSSSRGRIRARPATRRPRSCTTAAPTWSTTPAS